MKLLYICAFVQFVTGYEHPPNGHNKYFRPERLLELSEKWEAEWSFSGIGTFAHLEYAKCLTTPSVYFDIAIIGIPFDTATSYRPGARFGPRAIRQASARMSDLRGYNTRADANPFLDWPYLVDCGDIPVSPFDNALALEQMTQALTELGQRPPFSSHHIRKPRLISLGGDHSLALPALRALKAVYGRPVRVIHFDAHLDTWNPSKQPTTWPSDQSKFTHGSMFWLAGQEGLLVNDTKAPSLHAGLRTRLTHNSREDYDDDTTQNWVRISADDIDEIGTAGVIKTILDTFADNQDPIYLSVDIDVLDPAFAPGTGTPEPGGWTTRELIRILRGIEWLNVVGADIVEVAPAYQGAGEETALAAAQVVYEILTSMVKKGWRGDGIKEEDIEVYPTGLQHAPPDNELNDDL